MPQVLGEAGPRRQGRGGYGYVILGAGCAGLSLCYHLLERGVEAPILVLDKRTVFEDDRTWCFWDVEKTPFSHLALRRWNSWSVRAGGREVVHTSARHPYLCLSGKDFYEHALARIAAAGNVALKLGEEVRGYEEAADGVLVRTSGGTYDAGRVFDARGLAPGSPAFEEARRGALWVPQKFLGQRIRTHGAVFDPEVCTLMDFSVDQGRGLRFAYVLPFSEGEALVENVYLSEAPVSPEEHRAEISGYLRDRYALSPDDYVVDGEERGFIPMTDHRFPTRRGERVHLVGTIGGGTRPSTGYAFLRIQRYCRALAEAVTGGAPLPARTNPPRQDLLDGLFLRFVEERPGLCPGVYARMFAGVPPEPLLRFLTEGSTPLDEARLVGALPKTPFLKVAAGALLERAAGRA